AEVVPSVVDYLSAGPSNTSIRGEEQLMRWHCVGVTFAVFFCALCMPAAQASTFTWNNAAGGTFATASNWTPTGPPSTSADVADFNLNAIYNVNFGTSATIGSLNLTAGVVTFPLNLQNNITFTITNQ